MKWLPTLSTVLLAVTAIACALNFGLHSRLVAILWVALPVLAWAVLGRVRQRTWGINLMLFLFTLYVIFGAYANQTPLLLLITILGALAVWDLEAFHRRLSKFSHIQDETKFINRHLLQLGLIGVISTILFVLTQNVTLQFSLGTAVLLALLLVFGLIQAMRYLQQGDL